MAQQNRVLPGTHLADRRFVEVGRRWMGGKWVVDVSSSSPIVRPIYIYMYKCLIVLSARQCTLKKSPPKVTFVLWYGFGAKKGWVWVSSVDVINWCLTPAHWLRDEKRVARKTSLRVDINSFLVFASMNVYASHILCNAKYIYIYFGFMLWCANIFGLAASSSSGVRQTRRRRLPQRRRRRHNRHTIFSKEGIWGVWGGVGWLLDFLVYIKWWRWFNSVYVWFELRDAAVLFVMRGYIKFTECECNWIFQI